MGETIWRTAKRKVELPDCAAVSAAVPSVSGAVPSVSVFSPAGSVLLSMERRGEVKLTV